MALALVLVLADFSLFAMRIATQHNGQSDAAIREVLRRVKETREAREGPEKPGEAIRRVSCPKGKVDDGLGDVG